MTLVAVTTGKHFQLSSEKDVPALMIGAASTQE
jgi:hypothetical protein